jgi:hypothetical protein
VLGRVFGEVLAAAGVTAGSALAAIAVAALGSRSALIAAGEQRQLGPDDPLT